ncbi:UxaA family hydrolase [Pacificibacter marinus]|uniref:UxaA family hydrolase n=1 Tax=Pacificibacter marinus TaxID=658057 RepID=UPI0027BA2A0D|nr:UxaA family hydrolase [Pacificibacter marinus]
MFTTGRGSALGSKPAPTIKIATNDALYENMAEDMDINCGGIISGGVSLAQKRRRNSGINYRDGLWSADQKRRDESWR